MIAAVDSSAPIILVVAAVPEVPPNHKRTPLNQPTLGSAFFLYDCTRFSFQNNNLKPVCQL